MYKRTRKCYKTNTRARSAAGYLPPSATTPAPSEDKLEQRLPEDSKHTKRALGGQTQAYGLGDGARSESHEVQGTGPME